jgi:hypothetical protein
MTEVADLGKRKRVRLDGSTSTTRLECSECGAMADAACSCGAPYLPAGARAAQAVADNPGKSDRAIAADLGVGKDTIRRARKSTGANAPVAKRVGKDGKARRLPKKSNGVESPDETTTVTEASSTEISPEVSAAVRIASRRLRRTWSFIVDEVRSDLPNGKERQDFVNEVSRVLKEMMNMHGDGEASRTAGETMETMAAANTRLN